MGTSGHVLCRRDRGGRRDYNSGPYVIGSPGAVFGHGGGGAMASVPKLLKSPASQDVYARLIGTLKGLGPFTLEEKKTCLHLVRGHAFAGIHPRSTGLLLNLVLDQP